MRLAAGELLHLFVGAKEPVGRAVDAEDFAKNDGPIWLLSDQGRGYSFDLAQLAFEGGDGGRRRS